MWILGFLVVAIVLVVDFLIIKFILDKITVKANQKIKELKQEGIEYYL